VRILLVDDEPALRELLRATFEGADVSVDEAASALEAEARIRRRRPDVIVLDLRMPGMSGAEFAARLKAEERTRGIPIVLLTGADPEEARRAQRAGAAALVRKPFSPLDLLAVVERVVGGTPVPRKPRRAKHADEELLLYARDLRHLLEIERGQRALLAESYVETVTALASALETKDTGTREHSHRVQRYAGALIEAIDSGRLTTQPGIEYGFLLHDIGKIAIPEAILRKPGPLSPTERREMERHTEVGRALLAGSGNELLELAATVAWTHHEAWDGSGYPRRLAGEEIPLAGRIVAVSDVFDALTSDRPYRRAWSTEDAVAFFEMQRGCMFDPELVDALLRVREAGGDARASGQMRMAPAGAGATQ